MGSGNALIREFQGDAAWWRLGTGRLRRVPHHARGERIPKHRLSRIIRELTKRQIGVAVRAHDLRHLAVDMLLEADPGSIPVAQQLLGHSAPRVTEEIYHGRHARSAQAMYAGLVTAQLGLRADNARAGLNANKTLVGLSANKRGRR